MLTSVAGLTTQVLLGLAVLIVIIAIHIHTLILLIVLKHTMTANMTKVSASYFDDMHQVLVQSEAQMKSSM